MSARLHGRTITRVTLAVDTGTSTTIINQDVLMDIGLDPNASSERSSFAGITGVLSDVPLLTLARLDAMGHSVTDLQVASMTLPLAFQIQVDGLLGLNFLRNFKLFINFAKGVLVLQERNPRHLFHWLAQLFEVAKAHR